MVSKKKSFSDDEIAIFDDGCIYKRGDYWHFRLWLKAENKYARKSLGTTNRATALDAALFHHCSELRSQVGGATAVKMVRRRNCKKRKRTIVTA